MRSSKHKRRIARAVSSLLEHKGEGRPVIIVRRPISKIHTACRRGFTVAFNPKAGQEVRSDGFAAFKSLVK